MPAAATIWSAARKSSLCARTKCRDALQTQERRVALVHVVDGRLEAQRRQRAGAAHAEHDFLADAHFQVAAVELRGDGAVLGVVLGDVGVEQVEVDAADGQLPDLGEHLPAGQFDGDLERLAASSPLGISCTGRL